MQPDPRELRDSEEEATIRAAVRRAMDARGLRPVAREMELRPAHLTQFVNGSRPYPRTWEKLRAWYLQNADKEPANPFASVRVALDTLVQRLPPEHRDEGVERLVRVLGELAAEPGLPAPGWLTSLAGGEGAYGSAARPVAVMVVEFAGRRSVELPISEGAEQARRVAEDLATVHGVWHGRSYYPPHMVHRVVLKE